jgi:hypothetical protein
VCAAALVHCGQATSVAVEADVDAEAPFGYADYATALSTNVDDDGMVNYAALKESSGDLDRFLKTLELLSPEEYESWDDAGKIALWTNAYNAFTLKAIISHYPIQKSSLSIAGLRFPDNSIRQIPGVWDMLQWNIMGGKHTLEGIEHEILRAEFDEPRIHAALVCAAMSCPPLRNEPFVPERLDEQFDDQMKEFVSHDEKFRIDRDTNTVYLSQIFSWFGGDFVGRYGTDDQFTDHDEAERASLDAVSQAVTEEDANYLRTADYSIDYLDYDWTLNEQQGAGQ